MLSSADLQQLVSIRHHLHRHPELSREEKATSDFVAAFLEVQLGLSVERDIGGYGLVATVPGEQEGPGVGLRADMDALAIHELTGLPYQSEYVGCMHACGHDGHIAMLIGAAMILSRNRNFAGRVHLIFRPSEERYGGAQNMLDAGLLQRFPMQSIFGLHNWPGIPVGQVAVHDGPVMSGTSEFTLTFSASGGHAAMPHLTGDPILAGGHFVTGIQQAVARSVDPLESAVVTVGSFRGGHAQNIIPQDAELSGTLRGFRRETLYHLRSRVEAVAAAAAAIANCSWDLVFDEPICTPVVNTPIERDIMREAAEETNLERVQLAPSMGGDDFGDFLTLLPGAYALLGNGELRPEAGLHQPKYDFNDAIIGPGATLLARSALIALQKRV